MNSSLTYLYQEAASPELEESRNESKIAWKIRAQRKRQQKHLTLGLTREEFANIQESLRHRPLVRPLECKFSRELGLMMLIFLFEERNNFN